MEPFVCARCGELRDSDAVAARNVSGDRETVCIACLSPGELVLVGDSMDEIKCVSEELWSIDELARGDLRDPEVKRVALERRIAADPDSREWAQPILDRVKRQILGEDDAGFLE